MPGEAPAPMYCAHMTGDGCELSNCEEHECHLDDREDVEIRMPDPNTEHGLRVQLATALRERDEARKACAEMKRERDDYKEAHRHANETITVVFENRVKKAEEALSAEKARAEAAEHWKATYYAEALAAREALAAARRECELLREELAKRGNISVPHSQTRPERP